MFFEWNDIKNKTNFSKHGVWFEEAQTIWADKNSTEFFDPDHSDEEDRFIRIGRSSSFRLLLVVFCERYEDTVRIISARKATKCEQLEYGKRI